MWMIISGVTVYGGRTVSILTMRFFLVVLMVNPATGFTYGRLLPISVVLEYPGLQIQKEIRLNCRLRMLRTKQQKAEGLVLIMESNGLLQSICLSGPARIYRKITNIRIERIQDITGADIIAEGAVLRSHNVNAYRIANGEIKCPVSAFDNKVYPDLISLWVSVWDSIYAKPRPVPAKKPTHYESFPWSEDTRDHRIEINDLPHVCYPNPGVWVIEFEKTGNDL